MRKLGLESSNLDRAYINDTFDEVAEHPLYSKYSAVVQYYAAVLMGCDELRINAAKRVTYSQGNESQSLSDLFRNLTQMRETFANDLMLAINEEARTSPVRWGSMKKTPTRQMELPYDYGLVVEDITRGGL